MGWEVLIETYNDLLENILLVRVKGQGFWVYLPQEQALYNNQVLLFHSSAIIQSLFDIIK
jgi:hypothetical protein